MPDIKLTRRSFLAGVGTLAAAAITNREARAFPTRIPMVGSRFDPSLSAAAIKFGYASITWGGNDLQAISDIAEAGFRGIQVRANILSQFGSRPGDLRDLLAQHKLQFVALSSGGVIIDPGKEADEIAKHAANAKFVRDAGGLYLQLTDSARPKGRQPEPDDFKRLGRIMTEIGKRAADFGVQVGYHNHMNSLGEAPGEVDRIFDAADPKFLKFELDIAHYQQGGGDPVATIRKYHDRLLFLHIKDLESPVPDDQSKKYRFVELGRGKVDLPGVFRALNDVKFSGWAVVELDGVPDKSRTPKECAMISKRYLEEKIGFRI
ncbi:MAG TPA: sugar phosphate isomerase/epimerase [Blastocatellia bacterium]|nr:sugar phosphate isomerase/epimerase [Blastocatellia bacterium]